MSPSPFVTEWLEAHPVRGRDGSGAYPRVLDLAMGRGRHALPLARAGLRVFGVDLNLDALAEARRQAAGDGLAVNLWCADLTQHPLPLERFDAVLVTRYLQRDLFPAIRAAVAPGGIVIYETFTTRQLALGAGPKSPDHLLQPGELRVAFEGFDILFYEEVDAPEAVARVVAKKPRSHTQVATCNPLSR